MQKDSFVKSKALWYSCWTRVTRLHGLVSVKICW